MLTTGNNTREGKVLACLSDFTECEDLLIRRASLIVLCILNMEVIDTKGKAHNIFYRVTLQRIIL